MNYIWKSIWFHFNEYFVQGWQTLEKDGIYIYIVQYLNMQWHSTFFFICTLFICSHSMCIYCNKLVYMHTIVFIHMILITNQSEKSIMSHDGDYKPIRNKMYHIQMKINKLNGYIIHNSSTQNLLAMTSQYIKFLQVLIFRKLLVIFSWNLNIWK